MYDLYLHCHRISNTNKNTWTNTVMGECQCGFSGRVELHRRIIGTATASPRLRAVPPACMSSSVYIQIQIWIQMQIQIWIQMWIQIWIQMWIQIWIRMWIQIQIIETATAVPRLHTHQLGSCASASVDGGVRWSVEGGVRGERDSFCRIFSTLAKYRGF